MFSDTMSSPDLILHQPPFPVHNAKDSHYTIPKDPLLCSICCNLSPHSAFALIPRLDIIVHDARSLENLRKAKSQDPRFDSDVVPAWVGLSRLDYGSWQFSAMVHHIVQRAGQGCPSCAVLAAGILRLCGGEVSSDSVDVQAEIVFCMARVLRADVFRVEEEGEIMDIFGEIQPIQINRKLVASLDFYTMPGKEYPS